MMALLTLPHVRDAAAWGDDESSVSVACHSERGEESAPRADRSAERAILRPADPDEGRHP